MVYHCSYAERLPNRTLLQCRLTGSACGHQRYCPQKGKTILTQGAQKCPVRDK